jgi:hypothetical protein
MPRTIARKFVSMQRFAAFLWQRQKPENIKQHNQRFILSISSPYRMTTENNCRNERKGLGKIWKKIMQEIR